MGRGARKSGITATAVYLVEPKYFDDHNKKATTGPGKRKQGRIPKKSSRKKAKTSPNYPAAGSESDHDNSDDGSDIDEADQMDVDTQDGSATTTNASGEPTHTTGI